MAFLASVLAKVLEWILVAGGTAFYEWSVRLVEERKRRIKAEEALKRYQQAKEKNDEKGELDAEKDIINGD